MARTAVLDHTDQHLSAEATQQHLDTSCGNNRVLSQNQITRGGFEMARVAALDHSCAYAVDEIRFIR